MGFVNGKFNFKNTPVNDGNVIAILQFSKNDIKQWEEAFQKMGFIYESNSLAWIQSLKSLTGDYAIYVPEQLLEYLKKANVKYLLIASLRANPNENTGNIITTLHRFVYFIQLKYPTIFRSINTIGDQENAQLIEINY